MSNHLVVAAASFAAATLVFGCDAKVRAAAGDGVVVEDRIARERFDYLRERSATTRQMLAIVAAVPGTFVRVRTAPGLHHSSAHDAHGVLKIDEDSVQAMLEFDPIALKPPEQIEMLAHELAHVVEIMCLPRASRAGALQRTLLERGFAVRRRGVGNIGIETLFAVQVGRRASVEAMNGAKLPGQLASLSRLHGLGEPCAVTAATAAPRAASIR